MRVQQIVQEEVVLLICMKLRESYYSDLQITKHKILIAIHHWEIQWCYPLVSLYGLFTLEIWADCLNKYAFPFLVSLVSTKWQGMSRSLIQLAPTLASRSKLRQRRKLLLVLANSKFFLFLDAYSSSFACPQGKVAYPGSLQRDSTNSSLK